MAEETPRAAPVGNQSGRDWGAYAQYAFWLVVAIVQYVFALAWFVVKLAWWMLCFLLRQVARFVGGDLEMCLFCPAFPPIPVPWDVKPR